MNLNHLAIFQAVAEEGSVTRGADKLMVSQPAVSKQIRELERALTVKLFERRTKPLALTEAGKTLVGYAQRISMLADDAQRALHDLNHLRGGRLAIGASTTVGVHLLPDVLVYFRHRFPEIELRLELENGDILQQRLQDEILDVGITEAVLDSNKLQPVELVQDPFIAIAPPNHPIVRRRSLTLQEFCDAGLIVRETGAQTRSFVERALAARGMSIRPAIALGSTEAIKRAVAAGLGVAIVPRMAMGLELAAKKIARVQVKDLSIRRPLFEYTLRGRTAGKAQQAFMCVVKHAIRGTLPALRNRRSIKDPHK